jgi:hypothetical protein
MPRGLLLSVAGHAAVLALIAFGLPRWGDEPLEYRPLPVEIVQIDELVRAPAPAPKPKPQDKPEPPKPAPAKETPPPPPPPPQPEVAKAEPVPEPEPEPEKVEPEPQPEPEPEKVEPAPQPEPEKAEPEPEPEPEPAPEPKQTALAPPAPMVKPKPPQPKRDDFASLLKTVEELKDQPRRQPEETQEAAVQPEREIPPSQVPRGEQLTASEEDLVRQQIIQCWRVPAGARDAADLAVVVRVHMNRNGTVRSAELADPARANADPFRRAAAESALRATLNPRCQPFKLPPEKYDTWQVFTFRFDPQDLIY